MIKVCYAFDSNCFKCNLNEALFVAEKWEGTIREKLSHKYNNTRNEANEKTVALYSERADEKQFKTSLKKKVYYAN